MSFTRPAVNLDHRHSLDSLVTPQSAARFRPFHPRNFSKVILEPSRGSAVVTTRPVDHVSGKAWPGKGNLDGCFSSRKRGRKKGVGIRNWQAKPGGTLTSSRRDVP